MQHEKIDINLLDQNNGQVEGLPLNPRTWTKDELRTLKESLKQTPELFDARGIIVYPYKGRYVVLGGNMRLAASKQLRLKKVPCIVVPEGTPLAKLKEIVIKDNGSFGAWDVSALQNDWADLPLGAWGVKDALWDDAEEQVEDAQKYTRKIVAPTYEPKKDSAPELTDLYDIAKTEALIKDIEEANIPEDVKVFLRYAAMRHTVFNFENIAEYYARAPKELQKLMEDSALVIIDYNDAIRGGYVKLTEALNQYLEEDKEDAE